MDDKINIFKHRNYYKCEKKGLKMGVGEYVGILSFGIMSTGALAYNPQDLPLFIIGSVVIALSLFKFTDYGYKRINKLSYSFLIISLMGGIISSIGLALLLTTTNGWLIVNSISWIMMGVVLVKYNLDETVSYGKEY